MNDEVSKIFKNAYGYENNRQWYDLAHEHVKKELLKLGLIEGTSEFSNAYLSAFMEIGLKMTFKNLESKKE